MSCLHCEECGNLIDTDWDIEGRWSDTGYTCESCCDEYADGDDEAAVVGAQGAA